MHLKATTLAAGALVLLVATACSSGSNSSDSSNTTGGSSGQSAKVREVSIGFIDSLTGPLSFVGIEQQKALQIAVKDLAAEGVKVNLTTKDDQSTAAGAVSGLQQLTGDPSITGIIGEDSTDVGDAALPLLAKDGRPTIYLQITKLPDRPSNVFSMGPPTTSVAARAASYAYKTNSVKSVAFIHQVQPTLDGAITAFKSEAKKANVNVVSDQSTPLTTTSFGPQITNVLSAHPDAIGISAVGPASGSIISGLRSAGFKGALFAQQAADSAATVKTAGSSADGVLVGSYWDPAVGNPSSQNFVKEFVAAYPSDPPPDAYAIQAYDALRIMVQSIENVGTDKSKIVKNLQSNPFDAATQEKISFGTDGFAKLDGYVIKLSSSGTNSVVG